MNRVGNVLSWGSDLEPGTIEQAAKTSRLPFVKGHLALMPDAHVGLGATIGSVVPTKGAVVPAAVGVDLGCGMIAVETVLTADDLPDDVDRFLGYVEQVVPAGVGKAHQRGAKRDGSDRIEQVDLDILNRVTEKQRRKIFNQFGTLGSGNHFLELCLDERDQAWVVLHSGSRGIGKELAEHHIGVAKDVMKAYFMELEDPDLAYLVEGTEQFEEYIADMLWAQSYARANRDAMMDAVLIQLWRWVGCGHKHEVGREVQRVNCHHNYCERENHHGQNVWLTRKGAIRARKGDMGVIPGSMGTSSYIVRGLGNPSSYESCSHGAGRRMSRRKARDTLTVESLNQAMQGKSWNAEHARALLDEHPDAYKDVDQVMEDQRDLAEIVHTLRQIMNYKGM